MSKSSVKARTRKGHIKRPPNAWVIYRAVKSKEYQRMHPDRKISLAEMSGILSKKWAVEPEEEIRHYERLAEEQKLEHRALYPNYEYRPRTRGTSGKPTKPRKVKEGRVTKSRRTKKEKRVLPSAIDLVPTQPTNVQGSEWSEANGPAPASDVVVELGSILAPNDQHAVADANHAFYDNTIFSPDNFNVGMLDNGAQSMANLAYYGQPLSYACPSYSTMHPLGASQVNVDQLTAQLPGQTNIFYDQSYIGGESLQLFSAYGANTLYEQATQLNVAAGPSGANATAYSQNEGGFGYSEDVIFSTSEFTYPNATDISLSTTVDTAAAQDLGAVRLNQLADFLPIKQDLLNAWAAAGWV